MNFSRQRPVKVIMLGAGGTGAHIAPHLYRLLYALDRPVKFIICDGDKVEPKNLIRQNFTQADLGENKAKVIAERYSDAFGLETCYIPTFIEDAKRLEELIRREVYRCSVKHPKTGRSEWKVMSELVILIGAVDNNRSRKLCHDVFQKARELVYEERVTNLIQNGSQSLKIMERWIMRIHGLEQKKQNYEDILKRELTDLDEEFTSLRYLSDELRIRSAGVRSQKQAA